MKLHYIQPLKQPNSVDESIAVVGIDASRNRSGGAKTHLLGILSAVDPRDYGISLVHVWSYQTLLNALPNQPWLIKHNPPELEKSLFHQLWWQYYKLPKEIMKSACNVILSTSAGSICKYHPNIVMSRDMLSFESGEMQRYGFSFARFRLFLLQYMQVSSLRNATGVIFLTNYASNVIQQFTGELSNFRVIPHGISDAFRQKSSEGFWVEPAGDIKCVYISNTDLYKHQWHVVKAIRTLRDAGYPVSLSLIGGGFGKAKALLDEAISKEDPSGKFVELIDAVSHNSIPSYLAETDIFIFASSCENMPNTLVEAMASGLPIACSNRGPMPEILQDAGVYFDPEDSESIAESLTTLLNNKQLRHEMAMKAKKLSRQYSWIRCASETWKFLSELSQRSWLHYIQPLKQPNSVDESIAVVGIDASRNRSGGAKTHLLGILSAVDPRDYGISLVHVWSYQTLLNALPNQPWLIKHNPPELEKSLFHQLWWQYYKLPKEIMKSACNVILSTSAGSICKYHPNIVMSRDMLSFESGEMQRYGFSFARFRLFLLQYMQVSSLRNATGVIFLTNYASNVIQQFTGELSNFRVIPHGISDAFRQKSSEGFWVEPAGDIKCVYISNTDLYKHQWHVVKAIRTLRDAGYPVSLSLIGGGFGKAKALLDEAISKEDPSGKFVELIDAVSHNSIPSYLAETDIFIFASSCENMPNTLVEAMASGLPIACSNRGPMPEILQDAGVYFDPEDSESIAESLTTLLNNKQLRHEMAMKAKKLSRQYSWIRCASETWKFLLSEVA